MNLREVCPLPHKASRFPHFPPFLLHIFKRAALWDSHTPPSVVVSWQEDGQYSKIRSGSSRNRTHCHFLRLLFATFFFYRPSPQALSDRSHVARNGRNHLAPCRIHADRAYFFVKGGRPRERGSRSTDCSRESAHCRNCRLHHPAGCCRRRRGGEHATTTAKQAAGRP